MPANLNVLIAIPCLNRGGTEMQTLNLGRVLVSKGFLITTICYFEYNPDVVLEYEQAGSRVVTMDLNRSISPLKLIYTLIKLFKKHNPNIIHVQYMAPGALPILSARLAGIKKVVATVHQPYTPSHGRLAKLLLRISALLCTQFITVSQKAEESWFGTGQLFDENLPLKQQPGHFTIYNAVEVDRIQSICKTVMVEEARKRLNIPSTGLIFGVVSRLRYEKGVDLLVKAFAGLVHEGHLAHLLIVGNGPDTAILEKQVKEEQITQQVTFFGEAGWETAMQQMALMDVVVVPSRFEGFGLTAAEAMAMGKPVIASAVFGLKEVVTDGETGLLFEPENTSDLKESLKQLCLDPALCKQLGANGRIKAEKLFDYKVYSRKTSELYRMISEQ